MSGSRYHYNSGYRSDGGGRGRGRGRRQCKSCGKDISDRPPDHWLCYECWLARRHGATTRRSSSGELHNHQPEVEPGGEQRKDNKRAKKEGVYVLKLDDGCIYVGKSVDIDARIEQHKSGTRGAEWCRDHGVTRLEVLQPETSPSGKDFNAWEQNETIHQMMKHGFNKVRGWNFVQIDLPVVQWKVIKELVVGRNDFCHECGRKDHFVR